MIPINYPPGATPLDEDELDGLKLKHITARVELDRWEQDNIQDALAWVARRRRKDILTEEFVCLLHKKMFEKVWKWAGRFRRTDKNIGIQWLEIPVSVRQLLDDVRYWVEQKVFSPDEIAYRLHHKLVFIHLFPNGNGRHSRLLSDILLWEVFKKEPFTWGSQQLTDAGKARKQYIAALKAADLQDYSLLEKFVRS
ncbi:MAG: mobile mystery protein B [Candidatus Pseudobacter hemicellulosilyticus]|uniref:Mobile mystery protein B n=1 Tax=Candidatus Pseudobacter hemicellulosilyticus TaxID=3121375 RepID=A0AAJ5WNM2_9BACT|nr:MAG: mobile mystery protein B [Pseudobacter sp.]